MCEAKECVLTADCTTKDSVQNSGQTAETNTLADKHTELREYQNKTLGGLTQGKQRRRMTRITSYKRKRTLSSPLACLPKHPEQEGVIQGNLSK